MGGRGGSKFEHTARHNGVGGDALAPSTGRAGADIYSEVSILPPQGTARTAIDEKLHQRERETGRDEARRRG